MELILIKKPYCEACTIMANIVKNCLEQVDADISLKVKNLSSMEEIAHKVFPTLIFKKDDIEIKRLEGVYSEGYILKLINKLKEDE